VSITLGSEIILSGGVASGTTLDSSNQEIHGGGAAVGTVLDYAGSQDVLAGGLAPNTVVSSGGSASGTTLHGGFANGGLSTVESGGTAIGTTVGSGGLSVVDSGGVASGAMINGGTLEIASGGLTSGPVTFGSGGGTLQLDASMGFQGTVAGFGLLTHLDLSDIAFGTNTTLAFTEASNNQSGTLTVSDVTNTANISLLGQYVAGQFTMASDGHGGTMIGDPPLQGSATSNAAALAVGHG
jgi:autotransporter passenger strand-loop-strand repeat protein